MYASLPQAITDGNVLPIKIVAISNPLKFCEEPTKLFNMDTDSSMQHLYSPEGTSNKYIHKY